MRAGHNVMHMTLHLMRDDLPRASLALAHLDAFMPDHRPLHADGMPEVPGAGFRERVQRARTYQERLLALLGLDPARLDYRVPASLQRQELVRVADWLAESWKTCTSCDSRLHDIGETLLELEQQEASLRELEGLDVDLGMFHDSHQYLHLLLGIVPASNLDRLRDALALTGHVVVSQSLAGEHLRILIAGQCAHVDTLENLLSAAAFQRIDVPLSFRDQPGEVRQELHLKRARVLEERARLYAQLEGWKTGNHAALLHACAVMDAAGPYTEVREAARSQGSFAVLQGWLPHRVVARARALLEEGLENPFVLDVRPPTAAEQALVPVPERVRPWLKPFSALVRQYGIPRFGEYEPTVLFALTFALMFGMMFGDVGHGLVFILFGLALRRRLGGFHLIFVAGGSMAVLFGFLYGSVFGVEHWIHPLWIAPLSDPIYMLTVALVWGIVFLSLGSLIAISNRLRAGDLNAALFDPGGILSLVLYYALIGGLFTLANGHGFNVASQVLVILMLVLLVGYRWQESSAPYGERALTVLIEAFEIVNGWVAGSLSFLRVAAFSLNHVALSMAVFTLADMMEGDFGHVVTLVLGNLFIIVLEGIIVGIQTLRLEYYEGFSRYFYGDGRPFTPLQLVRRAAAGRGR